MANNPFIPDAVANAAVNAVAALPNSGTIVIYGGTQPTDANTALSGQTALVTLTLSATAFGAAAASGSAGSRNSIATANAITTGNAVATGTATWFRMYKSDGSTVVCDGSVGTSGCDINLASTSITSAQPVALTSFTITLPE